MTTLFVTNVLSEIRSSSVPGIFGGLRNRWGCGLGTLVDCLGH